MIDKSTYISLKLVHAKLQQETLRDLDISKQYSQENSRRCYNGRREGQENGRI